MQNLIALAGIGFASIAQCAFGQGIGSVRGTIRFESGAPLANAAIWTTSGQTFRDARTDSLGRFRFDSLRAGTLVVEAMCPDRLLALAVPIAVRRTVLVETQRESQLNATIARDACKPIPTRNVHVHWRGWYSAAFESSSFRPCAADTVAREVEGYGHPFGRHAWVKWPPTAWQQPGLAKFGRDTLTGGVSGFVEWSGMLHGPAPAGHMGMANYLLTIDSVFSVAADGRC